MNLNLSGKVAIVTGGGGAIGAAICRGFADEGAVVVIADIDDRNGKLLEQELYREGLALYVHTDVTSRESVENLCRTVLAAYGRIDILINNAGINVGSGQRKPIHEFDDASWKRLMEVDLWGVFNCSKPVIQAMTAAGEGRIVNVTSVVGLVPFRMQCAFAAAKAGATHLTRVMALELAPYGIAVNAVAPGSILMEGTQELFYSNKQKADGLLSHIPMKRPGNPEEIADTVLFLASSDRASYITGSVAIVDGGWTCGFARDF